MAITATKHKVMSSTSTNDYFNGRDSELMDPRENSIAKVNGD